MITIHVPEMLLREMVTEDLKCADANETVYVGVPTK